MIKIVGLGPGSPDALTIGAVEALQESENLYFRTEKHPTVDYLKNRLTSFKTCDNYYEEGSSFDEVYSNIAKNMIEEYKIVGELVYAVPGHPLVAERSVLNLINLCNENNIEYKILPAVSFVDAMMDRLQIDPIEGLKIIDAFDIKNQILDKRIGTIITQVYNPLIASEVKLELLEYYNDDTEIYYVRAAGIEGEESIRKIPIYELDMQEDIDYLTSVYIPKDVNNKKDFYDLINTIEVLRSEDGCAWDREQTHESIKNSLLEETYEVIEAIEEDDIDGLIEELGDVLLQVVFHSQIGEEEGFFNLGDITSAICKKLIHRHPHVFKNENIDMNEFDKTWEDLKREEKGETTVTEGLKRIPAYLPALMKAQKIQKKAALVGFDWDNIEDVHKKVKEEYKELLDECKSGNIKYIKEELGDLLFSIVNLARFLKVDPEEALNMTNAKFIKRFDFVEQGAIKLNKRLEDMTLEEMDKLWEKAKFQ